MKPEPPGFVILGLVVTAQVFTWSLIPQAGGGPMTPYDVYVEGRAIKIPKWLSWAKTAKAKPDKLTTEEAA